MSDPTTREQTCPSCGVPWSAHLGVAGTCRDLAAMKARVAELEVAHRRYEKVRLLRPQQFAALVRTNVSTGRRFDDLVDEL